MHAGLFIYLLCGFAWQLYNYYGTPLSARIREDAFESWEKGSWWRVLLVAAFVLGVLAWPLTIAATAALAVFFPSANEWLSRHIRRRLIDRPGMFEPQMPAARCTFCDSAMDRLQVPCAKCKVVWDVDHCKTCCDGKSCPFEVHGGWVCPPCAGPPIPVCRKHKTPLGFADMPCSVCGKPQPVPFCADCPIETIDPGALRCFECMMKSTPVLAAVRLSNVECLDCGVSIGADPNSMEPHADLSDAEALAFEQTHAQHRMEAMLVGGKRLRIAGPGWHKEKESEP